MNVFRDKPASGKTDLAAGLQGNRVFILLVSDGELLSVHFRENDGAGIGKNRIRPDGKLHRGAVRRNGSIRGNLRSKSYFDCSQLAAQFGGGGHAKASGFTVTGIGLTELADEVLEAALKMI